MTRVALDTNTLIYAELQLESNKGQRAADAILRVSGNGVISHFLSAPRSNPDRRLTLC